jgi:hypothetical protein
MAPLMVTGTAPGGAPATVTPMVNDIERVALVGETKWQQAMALLSKAFTAGKIRYFDRTELDQARAWLDSA